MHLLFVCTGNTCRSPLAEIIARTLIEARGWTGLTVASAGTSAWPESPASDGSLLVALEHAMDLSGHRARQLDSALVAQADLILTMGPQHLERATALGGEGKSHLLAAFASDGAVTQAVSDPFGGDLTVYRATHDELREYIERVLDRVGADRTDG